MIRPSLSIATRCAMVRALAMSWVMVTAVIPRSRTRLTIRLLIEWARIGSSPVVGSSKNRISGWPQWRGQVDHHSPDHGHHRAGRRHGGAVDRKSVVEGKSVSVRVDLGGRRIIKNKNSKHQRTNRKTH